MTIPRSFVARRWTVGQKRATATIFRFLFLSIAYAAAWVDWIPDSTAAEVTAIRFWKNDFYVAIIGEITGGDEELFRKQVTAALKEGHTVGRVRIYSPGGDLPTALDIGRQIRLLRASTEGPVSLPSEARYTQMCRLGPIVDQRRYYYNR